MTTLEISKMSIVERIQTMEDLWDSLRSEQEKIEPPKRHKDVLKARQEKIKSGETTFITIDELKSKQ